MALMCKQYNSASFKPQCWMAVVEHMHSVPVTLDLNGKRTFSDRRLWVFY